ncbi:MAG: uracil-DNA glycosylase [Phycisphaerae bacterium]|nr:uracil-DNA glycosylase [Phycisphaerae bacterium]
MWHMDDPKESLTKAGRQLIEIERLLGAQFLPAEQNPLPEMTTPAEPQPPPSSASADQKAAALARMDADEVKPCEKCELCHGRTNTVFGEGSADADLVFVGEGPGHEEDRTGRPFVGRAGELLAKMIAAMGLTRDDVFICNVIKCRAPGNRSPAPQEIQACWDYLVRQLQIIAPKVIVTLGNPATQTLLDTRTGITRMRGQWQQLPLIGEGLAGIAVMPTFHPAYLLRNYSVDARGKVWADLQQVMELLGLKPPQKNV